jgi:hypothetical protein
MRTASAQAVFLLVGLASTVGFAQRGGGGKPGGGPSPQQSAEAAQRAANAREWASDIEKIRAQAPPPPLPQIHFPTQNELLLSRLRWAEDPKREVAQYLDKLWKDAKDPPARRVALETFWRDAEKPKWVRPAVEAYFQQRSDGAPLRPAPEPAQLAETAKPAAVAKPAETAKPAAPPATP